MKLLVDTEQQQHKIWMALSVQWGSRRRIQKLMGHACVWTLHDSWTRRFKFENRNHEKFLRIRLTSLEIPFVHKRTGSSDAKSPTQGQWVPHWQPVPGLNPTFVWLTQHRYRFHAPKVVNLAEEAVKLRYSAAWISPSSLAWRPLKTALNLSLVQRPGSQWRLASQWPSLVILVSTGHPDSRSPRQGTADGLQCLISYRCMFVICNTCIAAFTVSICRDFSDDMYDMYEATPGSTGAISRLFHTFSLLDKL